MDTVVGKILEIEFRVKHRRFLKTEDQGAGSRIFSSEIRSFQLGIIKGLLITKKRQQHDRELPVEVGSSKSSQIL